MKKVLILTYYWPPSAGSGVQRWLKMAKYLPEFGWEPVIITPRQGTAPYYDQGLLKDVAPGTEVIYTATLEPFAIYNALRGKRPAEAIPVGMMGISEDKSWVGRLSAWVRGNVFVPDARVGWVPYARRAALARLAKGDIDLLVTTGPPHSTHLAGREVARQTGIPWLADLRDPWTEIYYNRTLPRAARARARDLALETAVLQEANGVTVVSPGMADSFISRTRRLEVIYNGYDEQDLPALRPSPHPGFVISHVGNFFPSVDAPGLWAALGALVLSESGFAGDLRLRFVGLLDADVQARIWGAGLGKYLDTTGPLPHKQAVEEMMAASLLLFSLSQDGEARMLVSGKVFEYLACGVPILPIGAAESGAAQVLACAGRTEMYDHNDANGLESAIRQAYREWCANGRKPVAVDTQAARAFSRKGLAREMAKVFEGLV